MERIVNIERRGRLWPLSVAPMMDKTDRDYRFFIRRITRHTLLYTEMITTEAVKHGDRERLLGFHPVEKPLALQLGGDDPGELAKCARLASEMGYDEINLNAGCPSDRVQNGRFGACLMKRPGQVADCVRAMRDEVSLPVTVKHRIGVDGLEAYDDLANFVRIVSESGCDRFIVHARIAILQGLSPKENRAIPPLRRGDVRRLKRDFPHLAVETNGEIRTPEDALRELQSVDGAMVGRAAYEDPWGVLSQADSLFYGKPGPGKSRREILLDMQPYLESRAAEGRNPYAITSHMTGLFAGRPGSGAWKRVVSAHPREKALETIPLALTTLPAETLDERPPANRSTLPNK